MNDPRLAIRATPVRGIAVRRRPGVAWTAGQLRTALQCLPDDTPIAARVAATDEGFTDRQVVTGVDFGLGAWEDRRDGEPVIVFVLQCEWPVRSPVPRQRPDRSGPAG
ncbi:DUF6225 family protein [Sphaerisporangium viridialbum]|uniref:DUF6225 family protein n=1 Tax=Sphaerisporangium viridialbum TaxID=46189 RepID=UPI003C7946EE